MGLELGTIEADISRVIEPLGYDLLLVEETRVYGRLTLRLYIDKAGNEDLESQVNLDDCAQVNRALREHPTFESLLERGYDFEVSSPGVERPLRGQADYERFVGHRAQIRSRRKLDGRRKWTGSILGVEDDSVLIEVDGQSHRVPLAEIAKAKLKPTTRELFARRRDAS